MLKLAVVAVLSSGARGMTASKLSVHAGGIDDATQSLLAQGQPRLIKLLDSFGSAVTTARDLVPNITIVGRIYQPDQPTGGDPAQAAAQWWSQNSGTITSNDRSIFWEGYNEPAVGSMDQMTWYTQFEIARVKILAQQGYRACIGQFSTGTPDVTNPPIIEAFFPAIDAAIANGGMLCLHEYSSPFMNSCFDSSSGLGWFTGRYRRLYQQFLIPTNRSIPLVISENGIDDTGGACGSPNLGGWLAYCDWWAQNGYPGPCANTYMSQLAWYDSIMREDSYVVGSTLFQIDCPGWDQYDVTTAIPNMIAYMQNLTTPAS